MVDMLGDGTRNSIGRFNIDGSVDMTFNTSTSSFVYAISGQVDGKVLVGGTLTILERRTEDYIYEGMDRVLGLARLNADGSLRPVNGKGLPRCPMYAPCLACAAALVQHRQEQ